MWAKETKEKSSLDNTCAAEWQALSWGGRGLYVISLSALFRDESRPSEVNLLREIQSILSGFCMFPLLPMKHLNTFNRFIARTVCQPVMRQ